MEQAPSKTASSPIAGSNRKRAADGQGSNASPRTPKRLKSSAGGDDNDEGNEDAYINDINEPNTTSDTSGASEQPTPQPPSSHGTALPSIATSPPATPVANSHTNLLLLAELPTGLLSQSPQSSATSSPIRPTTSPSLWGNLSPTSSSSSPVSSTLSSNTSISDMSDNANGEDAPNLNPFEQDHDGIPIIPVEIAIQQVIAAMEAEGQVPIPHVPLPHAPHVPHMTLAEEVALWEIPFGFPEGVEVDWDNWLEDLDAQLADLELEGGDSEDDEDLEDEEGLDDEDLEDLDEWLDEEALSDEDVGQQDAWQDPFLSGDFGLASLEGTLYDVGQQDASQDPLYSGDLCVPSLAGTHY